MVDGGINYEIALCNGNDLTVIGEEATTAKLLKEGIYAVESTADVGTEDKQALVVGLDVEALVTELFLRLTAGTVCVSDYDLAIRLGGVIRYDGILGAGDLLQIFCKLVCGSLLRRRVFLTVNYHVFRFFVIS